MWKQDYKTGEKGYTLAAALLLGKDEVIQQVLPHYKIDALVRIKDLLRYDDREYVKSNLVEAYEKLMDFAAKHLPDKFYMEGDQRVSLRTKIFREIIANLIVHREYTSAYPASFIIYNNRVETENANIPNGDGVINPKNFSPFTKNPSMAKFFIQLGRVDELGSGVINVNRLLSEYGGKGKPVFKEGDVFKLVIPLEENLEIVKSDGVSKGLIEGLIEGLTEGLTKGLKDKLVDLVKAIADTEGMRVPFYAKQLKDADKNIERYIRQIRDGGVVEYRGSKRTGGYYLTKKAANRIFKK